MGLDLSSLRTTQYPFWRRLTMVQPQKGYVYNFVNKFLRDSPTMSSPRRCVTMPLAIATGHPKHWDEFPA